MQLPTNYKKASKNLHSGQALIIILLVMSVTLAVVLSAVARSVTDVSVTNYEEDALRAFSAAEAGIEKALQEQVVTAETDISVGDSKYTVIPTDEEPTDSTFVYPQSLLSGESATFWLVSHNGDALTCTDSGGDVKPCYKGNKVDKICWGSVGDYSSPANYPAIELTFYYDSAFPVKAVASPNDYSGVKVKRVTYDPYIGRTPANSFNSGSVTKNNCDNSDTTCDSRCTIGSQEFAFQVANLNFNTGANNLGIGCSNSTGCVLLMKAKMLYNTSIAQPVGLDVQTVPPGAMGEQGVRISSEGTDGDSRRKVSVLRGFAEFPDILDAVLFSNQDLVKNN